MLIKTHPAQRIVVSTIVPWPWSVFYVFAEKKILKIKQTQILQYTLPTSSVAFVSTFICVNTNIRFLL